MNFKKRSLQTELMDDPVISSKDYQDCLRDLGIVNRGTLAYRPVLNWLRQITKRLSFKRTISILDVGSGGGDTLRHIAKWAAKHNKPVDLLGVDLNGWSKQYADQVTPASVPITFKTANIFDLDESQNFDFIISSLFTHHLTDEQLVQFLQWMDKHATYGWLINDLHRHPIAYYFSKYVFRFLRLHYMVQNDGPISVARAFTKADWEKYLKAAGIPSDQIEISWFFPFRYRVVRWKP